MKDAMGKINKTKSRFFEKIKWTNTQNHQENKREELNQQNQK